MARPVLGPNLYNMATRPMLKPFSMATVAAVMVALPKFIAISTTAAGAPELVEAVVATDLAWLKDAGTIGVLIWMVVWFQSGSQKKDDRIYELTTSVVKSIDKMADAISTLAAALDRMDKK